MEVHRGWYTGVLKEAASGGRAAAAHGVRGSPCMGSQNPLGTPVPVPFGFILAKHWEISILQAASSPSGVSRFASVAAAVWRVQVSAFMARWRVYEL